MSQEEIASRISRQKSQRDWARFRLGCEVAAGFGSVLLVALLIKYGWGNETERVTAARILFVCGLLLLGLAHAQAYQRICRSRREQAVLKPGSLSVFRPVSVWLEACKLLPESRAVIVRGVTGISALFMATAVVGLDVESLQRDVAMRLSETRLFSPKVITAAPARNVVASEPEVPQVPVVAELESSSESSEVAMDGLRCTSDGATRSETGEFHIVGYLTNPQGEIRTLLLANVEKNRGRFVGRISLEGVDSGRTRELQKLLDRYRATRPLFKLGYQARWVRPAVVCDVAHAGWTNMGVLREGHLLDFRKADSVPVLVQLPE